MTQFLEPERAALARFLPKLDDRLAQLPLAELERPGNAAIPAFRELDGPGLLVPTQHGGRGASPLDALRVQRAVGARAPSLAVASTMHHFSVATLVELDRQQSGFEWLLLEGIARHGHLVASGFAEGRPGQGIMSPTLQARPANGGFRLRGSKKPCSLSASMDLLTASVRIEDRSDSTQLGVAVVPATAEGLSRHPFWRSEVLAGAESDEVRLDDVEVDDRLIVRLNDGDTTAMSALEVNGFLWFELLLSASYLGMASALAERLLVSDRATPGERAAPAVELEGAMAALEGVARAMMMDAREAGTLQRALAARYLVQDTIVRAAQRAAELLGGVAFIRSHDVAYLLAAVHALGFHPPSRPSTLPTLANALEGHDWRLS